METWKSLNPRIASVSIELWICQNDYFISCKHMIMIQNEGLKQDFLVAWSRAFGMLNGISAVLAY